MSSVLTGHWKIDCRHQLKRNWLAHRRCAEREVGFRCSACRDRHFDCLLSSVCASFMPVHDGVFAWGHTLNRVAAILSSYGEEWVFTDRNVRLHPRMLIALHRNQYLCARQL